MPRNVSKYYPLEEYLGNQRETKLLITFDDIERVINDKLPGSSCSLQQWWSNENEWTHVQAKAWLNAGWKVEEVKLGEYVVFIKNSNKIANY